MMRALILDQQSLYRLGMRLVLELLPDCKVVGEAESVLALQDAAPIGTVDVALLGVGHDLHDFLSDCQQLRSKYPGVAIILITTHLDEEKLFRAMRVGVAACRTRYVSQDELRETVRCVARGEFLITSADLFTDQHYEHTLVQKEPVVEATFLDQETQISQRETEILEYIARGCSNKEIAKSLKISDQTVKNHITSILKKLQVQDRTAAVVYALRSGWIKLDVSTKGGQKLLA